MRIVVLGGCGDMGSHVVRDLMAKKAAARLDEIDPTKKRLPASFEGATVPSRRAVRVR